MKGNGSTRIGRVIAREDSIKSDFASEREKFVSRLKEYRLSGAAGDIANQEIDRAIGGVDDVLKRYESLKSVSDVNSVGEKAFVDAYRVSSRLDYYANIHRQNAENAIGRRKRTYEIASNAMGQVAYLIRSTITERYGIDKLIELEDIYRKKGVWR